jgi:predicted DNA-binding protein
MYTHEEVIKQFPVRLGNQLHDDLERISSQTHINKSVLVRISIERLINEIDLSGVSVSMNNILGVKSLIRKSI